MSTLARRSLLGTVAGLALGPAVAAAVPVVSAAVLESDAVLIEFCNAFHEAHQASLAAPDDTDEWEIHLNRRWEISDELEGMEPITRAGKLAKVKVALVLLEEQTNGGKHEDFVFATLEAIVSDGAA